MSATRFIYFMLKLNDGFSALMFGRDVIASYLHNTIYYANAFCQLMAHGAVY